MSPFSIYVPTIKYKKIALTNYICSFEQLISTCYAKLVHTRNTLETESLVYILYYAQNVLRYLLEMFVRQ